MNIDISIIIVNYNNTYDLRNCVQSIYEFCNKSQFEIIIVDNKSQDRTFIILKEDFPEILLIENENNYGYGKANNIGASHAKGKFLFFLNPDTLLLEDSLMKLRNFYKENEKKLSIGVLGTLLVTKDLKVNNSGGDFPKSLNLIIRYIKHISKINKTGESYEEKYNHAKSFCEIDYVSGANLFIKKNVFFNVSGFNPKFFMYFEETDLQFKLRKKGYKSYIINETRIIHLEDGSTKQQQNWNQWKRVIFKESCSKYLKYNDPIFYPLYWLFLLFFGLISLFNPLYSFKENFKFYKTSLF